ncbi:hypothetical protein [Sphingomonas alba]|uniref:hypothetical protein n=1 Tax=Sphingomonas alba TaxID=2908208 RepID=UPI003D69B069
MVAALIAAAALAGAGAAFAVAHLLAAAAGAVAAIVTAVRHFLVSFDDPKINARETAKSLKSLNRLPQPSHC